MGFRLATGDGVTLGRQMASRQSFTGFDYLRVGLCVAILVWHSLFIAQGVRAPGAFIWSTGWRVFPASLVPSFFALSGFLVAGSLERNALHHFLILRVLRIAPALAFEVILSACVIGALFTSLPLGDYLRSAGFWSYFLNIFGMVHTDLPKVFMDSPLPEEMNGQLWTIPFEMECYVVLSVLALAGLVWKRHIFLAATALYIAGFSVFTAFHPVNPLLREPAHSVVAAFLCGVALYVYRDRIPYNNRLGLLSLLLSLVSLTQPNLAYISVIPLSYVVVWIGLKNPPPIPFGDLSYGIFLFHVPVEQVVYHLIPIARTWWSLSVISLPVVAACAAVSWLGVEKPALSRKRWIIAAIDTAWAGLRPAGRSAATP